MEQNTGIIHLFSKIGFKSSVAVIIPGFESSYSGLHNDTDKVWIIFFCGSIFGGGPFDGRDQKHMRCQKDKPGPSKN